MLKIISALLVAILLTACNSKADDARHSPKDIPGVGPTGGGVRGSVLSN